MKRDAVNNKITALPYAYLDKCIIVYARIVYHYSETDLGDTRERQKRNRPPKATLYKSRDVTEFRRTRTRSY